MTDTEIVATINHNLSQLVIELATVGLDFGKRHDLLMEFALGCRQLVHGTGAPFTLTEKKNQP